MTTYFTSPEGRKIAYHRVDGDGIGVVFLGGFHSDMTGTKAMHLEKWAKRHNRPFLRFDYSGHGESSGNFLDGCIGDWAQDAIAAVQTLTTGKQILVGSSMGGWISLILTKRIADRVAGFIGIVAAPDFTEDSMWANFDQNTRAKLIKDGRVEMPSEYADEPYIITRRLIEDGRDQLVLRQELQLPFPARLLHGTADTDVETQVALRLLHHAKSPDMRLCLVKDADHRFSSMANLAKIVTSIEEVSRLIAEN